MKSVSFKVMQRRDIRGKLTSEAVSSIRTVKVNIVEMPFPRTFGRWTVFVTCELMLQVNGWEKMAWQNITAARDYEMKKLLVKQYLSGVTTFISYSMPILVTALSFGVYTYCRL